MRIVTSLSALVPSLSIAPLLVATVALGDERSPALDAVQGTWTTRQDAEVAAKWTIKGETIKILVNGVAYAGKLVITPDAAPHPALTIKIEEGPGEAVGKESRGVYKLEADVLTVNLAAPGGDRPVDFNPFGSNIYRYELTRVKDAP